jgi:catechol 2,3-dioxygenase-like lactoylglutathione lyase family enzyme
MTATDRSNPDEALFPTERRAHVGLAVRDLDASVAFYRALLDVAPSKRRAGYAKFEPADPSLNLTLNAEPDRPLAQPRSQHYGLQVKSTAAVVEATRRLDAHGIPVATEEAVSCCYAVQDKVWAVDPDGHRWEVFVVLDPDVDDHDRRTVTSDCCPAEGAACCDDDNACRP